jgi:hypothetical protein
MARTRRPAAVAAALALPIALAAGVITAAVVTQHGQPSTKTGPVVVAAVPAPASGSAGCSALLGALPDNLGDAAKAELASPAPAGAAAWRASGTTEPLVLRCGIERPAEFDQAAPLVVVNGVQWLQISGAGAMTWVAVDRGTYVGLTVPDGAGSAALQDASNVIKTVMPPQALDPAPVR